MAQVARHSPVPVKSLDCMDASPAPRRLDMNDAAAVAPGGSESNGDDAATLELVWRLQREEEARLAEMEAAHAHFATTEDEAELSQEEAESLALAIRLQQEEDDAALRAVLGPGAVLADEDRDGARSPSQYSYETLMRLGEALGEVSKGASNAAIGALPVHKCADVRTKSGFVIGEQCSICRMEVEDQDDLMCLPCGHAEHNDCLGEWLKRNRSCPLCLKEIDAK
mmetsp:Transcript_21594/g.65541  ORF Transcript_21594/g.65541 Transcript_21594/m.65541 type:complete len:225 (-) Transcript_21594:370-1044(-)